MTSIQSVIKAWRSFRRILNPAQRLRTWLIYTWAALITVADIAGLSAMVPVLMLAIDHSFLEKSGKLRWIYYQFGFSSESIFLKALIVFILTFFLVKSLFALLLNRIVRKTAKEISTSLSGRSFDHAFRYNNYEKVSSDGLGFTDHVMFTPYYYVAGVYLPFINLLSESAVMIMLIAVFTIYKPALFLLTAGLLGFTFYAVNRYTKNRIARLGESMNSAREAAMNDLNFGISGFTDVKAHGVVSFFRDRFLNRYSSYVNSGVKAVNYQLVPARVNEFAALTGIVILVIYGYYFSGDNLGEVRVLAALYAISVFRLVPAANRLMQALMHLKMNSYTIDKLMDMAKHEAEEDGITEVHDFSEKIELKNVSFSYQHAEEALFTHIDLTVEKGSLTGIKGPSGSGKTTIAKILLGFHKPAGGEILIDGRVSGENEQRLNLFSYMGQHSFVLGGTVAENVALGISDINIDRQRVEASLKAASFHLAGVKDLMSYEVGENGARLSEGQKQRLVLAREIYRDAPVFILDEPTSALDGDTEREVLKTLQSLQKAGKTIIVIAHRNELLSICTEVYEIKNGELKKEV